MLYDFNLYSKPLSLENHGTLGGMFFIAVDSVLCKQEQSFMYRLEFVWLLYDISVLPILSY